ncbi:MAG: hypothetical protein PHQ62_03085 [Clostridia bacterium]|nr:hypothetical protein [Clostridia bacterium]
MISLEEYAKVCSLISSCNDIIHGKFILADYKITSILKNIGDSKEIYNLIANCMNDFNFEREFSRAQLKYASKPNQFILPTEPEKILPFVFCVLVNIKNKNINFDAFLKEFYKSEEGRAREFSNFANQIILPFRNIIANFFEIPISDANNMISKDKKPKTEDVQPQIQKQEEGNTMEENFDNQEEKQENYAELTTQKVEEFLNEIKSICKEILSELNYQKRMQEDLRENIIYITNAIIFNCENNDLRNAVALITAFEYVAKTAKSIKFLTKELKNVLINFYE